MWALAIVIIIILIAAWMWFRESGDSFKASRVNSDINLVVSQLKGKWVNAGVEVTVNTVRDGRDIIVSLFSGSRQLSAMKFQFVAPGVYLQVVDNAIMPPVFLIRRTANLFMMVSDGRAADMYRVGTRKPSPSEWYASY